LAAAQPSFGSRDGHAFAGAHPEQVDVPRDHTHHPAISQPATDGTLTANPALPGELDGRRISMDQMRAARRDPKDRLYRDHGLWTRWRTRLPEVSDRP
jgi:hypothetical protein